MYFFVEMGKGIDLDTLYSRQEARTASIRGPQSDRMLTGGHVKYRHIKKFYFLFYFSFFDRLVCSRQIHRIVREDLSRSQNGDRGFDFVDDSVLGYSCCRRLAFHESTSTSRVLLASY